MISQSAEAMDMGMPYHDFRTIIMPHCSGLFRFFGGLCMIAMNGGYRTSYEPTIRILTRREPVGVVAATTPFNFPLALTCSKVAPALAAGNTIVHKPVSDTPLTGLALAQVVLDAGIPEGVYNLVTGPGGSLGDALVKNPKVDKIAFTGSTAKSCWRSARFSRMRSLRDPKALTIQPTRCRSDQNMAEISSERPQQNSFQVVHFTSARRFDDGQLTMERLQKTTQLRRRRSLEVG
jgi:hypothetical protein